MLFNSFSYGVFLPTVFLLYWWIPHRFRWILLLIASYYFYMSWNVKYLGLIFFTTAVSYCAAILLEKQKNKGAKKMILAGAGVLCLGVLFFFKYFNFVSESVAGILKLFAIQMNPITLQLLLPVGISFYTFQTLSYVIDVYRGDVPAETHFGYYATFISFFPQLVAGPIERTANLLPQIKTKHDFCYEQASYGMKLMAWGFFKKIVIADSLSKYVSAVYSDPHSYFGFALVLATWFFLIQVYCDFSGYSDIAIGTAKLLGINLMTNFRSPYFSQSIREFWHRWHISLSTWFKDYFYIPLGGSRKGKVRKCVNLLLTFLLSGLWHGANWTYVVWGGIHGAAQILEAPIVSKRKTECSKIRWWMRVVLVFLFSTFSITFFRANSVGDAAYVIWHAFDGIADPVMYLKGGLRAIGMEPLSLIKESVPVLLLAVFDYVSLRRDVITAIGKLKKVIRWTVYVLFMLMVVFLSQKGIAADFVYFQF